MVFTSVQSYKMGIKEYITQHEVHSLQNVLYFDLRVLISKCLTLPIKILKLVRKGGNGRGKGEEGRGLGTSDEFPSKCLHRWRVIS